MNIRKPFLFTFAVTLGFFAAASALAWTGPTGTPPSNNALPPLNTSATAQSKTAGLILNTGAAATGLVVYGNVGVGTAAPTSPLYIQGGANNSGNTFVINNRTRNDSQLAVLVQAGLSSGDFAITTAGGVGVGTTAPNYKLTVADSASPVVDVYYTAAAAAGNKGKLLFDYNRSDGSEEELGYIQGIAEGTASNGGMRFVARNGADQEAMRITSAGLIAIGTTTPFSNAKVTIDNTAGMWGAIINYFNGTPGGVYGLYTSGATYALYANGPLYVSGSATVTGSVTSGAFYYSSDERLKKNIQAIASSTALQKILALQPVTFNWIDPKQPTTTQIGFIAQQVESVVPELVTTNASTSLKAVDYARVTPLLVGAAQAQQAQIDAQQKEIDELTAEVAALKAGR